MRTDQGSWHAPTVVVATGAASVAACRAGWPPGARRDHHADRRGLPQPRPAPGRRRAGRRRLGQRGPDRRGAAALRATGDAGRRRARPDAADLPGPRHPVVDGRVGPARRALRRGAGPGPGAQPAVDAAGRLAGADASTSTRCAGSGCGWSAGSPASATGRPSSPAPCPTCARWPTSSWAGCWTPSTPGPTGPGSTRSTAAAVRADRGAGPAPLSARLGTGEIEHDRLGDRLPAGPVRGSTSPCSTARAGSCTTAGSPPAPACT